jgi:hypothetical protein
MPDPFDSLEMTMSILNVMESNLLSMRQVRQHVGKGRATQMLDSLIQEAESKVSEIKRRMIN